MNQPVQLPPEPAMKTAAIVARLIELAADCVLRRTASAELAQGVADDVRRGEARIEFVISITAEQATVIGIEHRRESSKGLVDITLVPDMGGALGPGH